MSLSNGMETKVLNWLFKTESDVGNSTLRPTAWYVALCITDPDDSTLGTEVSTTGTAYVRKVAAFTVSGDQATNTDDIEFPEATADYGTVKAVMIMPTLTGGTASDMIVHAQLTLDKSISTGDIFRIPAGDLDINMN